MTHNHISLLNDYILRCICSEYHTLYHSRVVFMIYFLNVIPLKPIYLYSFISSANVLIASKADC